MQAHELRRRAIAAVAKLSIFAGAAGCGNVVVDATDAEESSPDDTSGAQLGPYDGQLGSDEGRPAPPDKPVDPPPVTCDKAPVPDACCNDLLTKSFSDDHLYNDPTTATDEEKACCELAVTTMDTWDWSSEPPFNGGIPSSCCSTGLVEGAWEQHPSCTPWGPPMPPRMPRRLMRRSLMQRAVMS